MIEIPRVERPAVSVVIVTYGRWDWASSALGALVGETPLEYEVILVDNAHPDGTGDRLERDVAGANLLRNDTNAGFGPACNRGAAGARGAFLCFLNSDALVQPGWLEPLLGAFHDGSVAAAVPCLLNLDGTVQDAGPLVGSDGRTVALGAGADPRDFAFRFPRDVDYGSAACLVVRRAAFEAVGGFDPAYEIGYCEDVEFGFRLSERGLVTRFEPRSRVLHAGGASSSPEEIERLVRRNTKLLRERWARKLALRPSLAGWESRPDVVVTARDVEAPDRFLVIVDDVPGPGVPTARFLEELCSTWPRARVTLLAAGSRGAELNALPLLARGVEVVCDPESDEDWFETRLFHYSVVVEFGGEAARRFGRLIERTQPQAFVTGGELLVDARASGRLVESMARFGVAPPAAA